jgi:peptide-methionine (R)-S-oxide reductase
MPNEKVQLSDGDWRARLTQEQYRITRQQGTERPFTGPYWNTFERGIYSCVCCDAPLFRSDTKFDAGCGWPSFFEEIAPGATRQIEDRSHGMRRIEIRCAACDGHLGHVFPDGPKPTGLRFCMNGHAMRFAPETA